MTPNGTLREISGGGRPNNSSNVFFRFNQFDTRRDGISGVKFLNNGRANVFVGVAAPTVVSVPVQLQNRGNLYWLSPFGIQVLPGASFAGVDTLLLTTSRRLALVGGGVFDALDTTDFSDLVNPPSADLPGLLLSGLGEGTVGGNFSDSDGGESIGIQIADGVTLNIDRSLLLVSNSKPIEISSATLSAAGSAIGDGLAIVGQNIAISNSMLKSNSLIELREPLPAGDHLTSTSPAEGMLASPKVSSNCATAGGVVSCASLDPQQNRPDTLSSLKITDTTLTDAGSPASTWQAVLKITGWGCRDAGVECPAGDQGGFTQIGATSTGASNPGRRAYRGLDAKNVVIKPGSGVATLDVTVALDWGAIDNLEVISPSTVTARAVRFRTADGADIAPGDALVVAFAESLGLDVEDKTAAELRSEDARVETYALGWSLGKVSDITDSANANVSYSGVWYDGGDATFNNITISYLNNQGPMPVPVPDFDRVLFNFDQTVFSDADATSGVTGSPANQNSELPPGVTLDISLDEDLSNDQDDDRDEAEADQSDQNPSQ